MALDFTKRNAIYHENDIQMPSYVPPMIVRVFGDGSATDVPVTPETTCSDLIECCRDPGDESCDLIAICPLGEYPLRQTDHPLEILERWGSGRLLLRYTVLSADGGTYEKRDGMKESEHGGETLPDGVQLTLSELREMACRQQAQIESQHQLLAAKEQRLRYLKEQEARQQRVQAESERLRRLRDRVDAQELKLRKLRAIRGQVDHQKQNNISLTSDLDSIRALFNEKEKELSMAVAKVDELTKQLEELRRGRPNRDQPPASALELDKLRRELMYRNKLNEQQNYRLNQQREALTARQEEMSAIDKRISELQERLHRKRLLNQQLANQISVASHKAAYNQFVRFTTASDQNNQIYHRKPQIGGAHPLNGLPRNNIAAVEPYNHVPLANSQQIRHNSLQENTPYHPVYQQNHHIKNESDTKQEIQENNKLSNNIYSNRPDENDLKDFNLTKSDPKYQTLPYNTKFTVNLVQTKTKPDNELMQENKIEHQNGNFTSQMVHSAPLNVANKNIATPLNHTEHLGKKVDNNDNTVTTNSSINHIVYQKPVNSVAPTSVQQTGKISNIYQTSSIKVQPIEPQIITNNGKPSASILSPPQSTSTPLGTPEINSDKSKPALPPKPAIKPPPRQTQLISEDVQPIPPPLPLTEPPEEHFSKKLEPIHPLTLDMNKLQGNLTQIGLNSPLTHSPLSQNSPITNSPVLQHSPVTHSPILQHSPQLLPNHQDNMPIIKAKPLMIKKPLLSEQPKLRTQSSYSRMTRRIEMPPAFHFPEIEKSEVNGNETSKDDTDKSSDSTETGVIRRCKKGNLKQNGKANLSRRVSFDPLALLLDASLEGELELVKKTATQVTNPSAANDEGITALHNAICAGHLEIVKFLVEFGCDVNAQDSDGWTPLHCAASCNNVAMVRFLVEHGACIFATTLSDHETAAEKCEEDEEGFDGCSEYLYSVQEKLGILSGGAVFAVFDYLAQQPDELSYKAGQQLTVLRKGDENEREWWWARIDDKEGYIPRNLLGLYPRVSRPED